MTEYTFKIPTPPSVNNLYANVPGRGRVKSQRYRTWRNAAMWAMKLDGTKPRTWQAITGPVSVDIWFGGRLDADNCTKALCDLLTDMGVIGDDSQVMALHVSKHPVPSRECIVTVRSFGNSASEVSQIDFVCHPATIADKEPQWP